jgi:hypothetical protein
MEGIFLILIGAAIFSHSWYILGMYAEGRMMGVLVGGLGLMSLAALTLTPMLLTGDGKGADMLAETTAMKSLIAMWAVYAVAVAAHGLWDFEERAIGFYCAFLAIATLAPFLYFAVQLESTYSNAVWLGLSAATLVLTTLAVITFFYLGLALNVLRLVAGWFLLLGGVAVAAIGLGILSAIIV